MDFVRTGEPQTPSTHPIWLVAFEDTTGQILGDENDRGEETASSSATTSASVMFFS
jgi:hypothetical protein